MSRGLLSVLVPVTAVASLAGAVALAASPSAPPPAFTALGDPVDVRAERMDVDLSQKTARLEGKVVLRRGELSVSCARIDARYDDAPRVTWAHAAGLVVVDYRGTHAEATDAEIDLARHTVDLRGAVTVTRAGARLSADSASIDLSTLRVSLASVHGVIAAPPPPSAQAPVGSSSASP